MKKLFLILPCLLAVFFCISPSAFSNGFFFGTAPATGTGTTINISTCTGCQVVNVRDIGLTPDDGVSDNAALKTYLNTHKSNTIYYFPKGTYTWTHPIDDDTRSSLEFQGLSNVAFVGEPGAKLQKVGGTSYNHEWMFNLAHSTNVTFTGLEFAGMYTSTTTWNSGNYQSTGGSGGFGEQGVHCASCDGFYVNYNYFHDFGDGAVRAAASGDDAPCTSNSKNTYIDHNRFFNIFQITTTNNVPDSGGACNWGGSNNWNFTNNVATNMKGSVKYCARYTTSGGYIAGNYISGTNIINNGTSPASASVQVGIEYCGVSNLIITNNIVENCGQRAIFGYTNPQPHNFPWGWISITNNIIRNNTRSLRLKNDPYPDGVTVNFNGVVVSGNLIYNNSNTSEAGIQIEGNNFRGITITGNAIIGAGGGSGSTGITAPTGSIISGNTYVATP